MVLHSKHQKKVLECYPTIANISTSSPFPPSSNNINITAANGGGDSTTIPSTSTPSITNHQVILSTPISAKLSALIYYINAKPQKLNKVMPFLEKKIKKDLIKESIFFNIVTIGILNGIIKECSEYFDGFATSYLNIMITFADEGIKKFSPISSTTTMTPATTIETNNALFFFQKLISSWDLFCLLLKSKLPIIRSDTFFDLLTRLLSLFLQRMERNENNFHENQKEIWRLKSINSLVKIDDFKTFKGELRMKIIVNFLSSISDEYWEGEALRIFSIISQNSNTVSLSYFLDSCFKYWNLVGWDLQGHIKALLNVIIENLPSQYLYHYINSTWQQAMSNPNGEAALVPLIDSIAQLLISNRGPLGYSALQIASNLMKLMRKEKPSMTTSLFMPATSFNPLNSIPSPSAPLSIAPSRSENCRQQSMESVFSICNALIAILRNTTFAPQKHEIICHLINRIFFPEEYKKRPTSLNVKTAIVGGSDSILQAIENKSLMTVSLNSSEEGQYKNVMWSVLFSMAEESLNQSTFAFLAYSDIPERLLEFIYRMIQCPDAETRLNSLILFHILLSNGLCLSGRQSIGPSLIGNGHYKPIIPSSNINSNIPLQVASGNSGIDKGSSVNSIINDESGNGNNNGNGNGNNNGNGGNDANTRITVKLARSATLNKISLSYFAGARASLYISMLHEDNILEHYASIYNCMVDMLNDGDETNALIIVQFAFQAFQHLKRRRNIEQIIFFHLLITQVMEHFAGIFGLTMEINVILENFREKLKMTNFVNVKLCNVLERTEPIPQRLASDQIEFIDFEGEFDRPIRQILGKSSRFEIIFKNVFRDDSHYIPEDELDKMSNIPTPDVKKFIPSHLLQIPSSSTDKTILHRHSLISLNSETIQSSNATTGAYNASITGMSLPTPGYQSISIMSNKRMTEGGASIDSISINGERKSSSPSPSSQRSSDYYSGLGDSNLLEGKFEQLTMKSKETRKKDDLKKKLFQSDDKKEKKK